MKKTAGGGPLLMTQTSSNSQQLSLQHQISSDTKEDTEGDNCKNWKELVRLQLVCKRSEHKCRLIPTEIQSFSMYQHVKCLFHNTLLTAFPPFFTSHAVRASWSPPKVFAAQQHFWQNYWNSQHLLLGKTWICSHKSASGSLSGYQQVSAGGFKHSKSTAPAKEGRKEGKVKIKKFKILTDICWSVIYVNSVGEVTKNKYYQ